VLRAVDTTGTRRQSFSLALPALDWKTDGRRRRNSNGAVHRGQCIHAIAAEKIIEIICTMTDDPDNYRRDLRVKLLEVADTMPLAEMVPAREDKVRAFVRETISTLLTNARPN
jgi:hypothetical protein